MYITDCEVNHLQNPIGYRMEHTTFSWKVRKAKGDCQRFARLKVAKDENFDEIVWDSGEESHLDSVACEADFPLEPRTRYYWKVQVISDIEESAESDTQFFETAKREESWSAKWISCNGKEPRHPIFYKKLQLRQEIQTARLYICGLGLYEAFLDGEKIGGEYLTPYCNDYNRWIQYQTYDVTDQIRNGAELSVLLGNGWYKGRFSFSAEDVSGKYGNDFKLIAELHIDYKNGEHEVIGTDETWTVRRSHILFSGIYDGERRDDTLPELDTEKSIVTEADCGILTERLSLPVKVYKEWNPVELIHTPAGEDVLDMGQNFSGIFRMHIREPKGKKIKLQFGEVLQEGNFFRDNLRTALAEYEFVSNGIDVVLEPHFTFYGYRYVKVTGVSHLQKEDFTALALSSTLRITGQIHTGNALINQLVSNTWWGLQSNSVDVPTDCPQRDERLGWTGDAQVFSETACYMQNMYAFYSKYLYDMAQEQKTTGGKVPDYIPSRGEGGTSSVWGDASCIIPWTLYRMYGDKEILRLQYSSMKSWVEYIRNVDGENRGWGKVFHYGDWLALDHETGDPSENSGATDVAYIAYIYYMNSACLTAKAAKVLNNKEDEEKYTELAGQIKQYIRYEFFTGSGRCCINTQTAYILALQHHLTDDVEWTKKRLRELFFHKKDKLITGFVGTSLACPVLSENGMGDLAYKLLLNEQYPGWLYAVKLGATTIWERWDSILADGTISGTGMNSLNHYAYGSITQWIYQYVGGIRQCEDSVGYRKVLIAPSLNWKLRKADVKFDSPVGEYRCAWNIVDENHVDITIWVPFGGQVELILPEIKETAYEDKSNLIFANMKGKTCILSPGTYHILYETNQPLRTKYSCSLPLSDLFECEDAKNYLLGRVPQLGMIKVSYHQRTLADLLMTFAGYVGLPDKTETKEKLIPELDEILGKYS